MDPEERFQRIEALLHAMAERGDQTEIRFNKRMDDWERRSAESEAKWERRQQAHERRTAKLEHQMQVTHNLVRAGMKIVMRHDQQLKRLETTVAEMAVEVKELAKSQRAFLDSLRKGGNGFSRAH